LLIKNNSDALHHPVEVKEVEIGQGMNDIDENIVSRIRKKTFYS
jgi:hypothetical protein